MHNSYCELGIYLLFATMGPKKYRWVSSKNYAISIEQIIWTWFLTISKFLFVPLIINKSTLEGHLQVLFTDCTRWVENMNIKYNYIIQNMLLQSRYRLIYYYGLWLRSILNTIESFKSKLTWFGCIYVDIRKLDPTLLTFPCGKASYLMCDPIAQLA